MYLITFVVSIAFLTLFPINYDLSLTIMFLFIIILIFIRQKKIIFFVTFILVFTIASQRIYRSSINEKILFSNDVFRVQICDEPKIFGKSQSFLVSPIGDNHTKINVVTNQFPEYSFGDSLEISGQIKGVELENNEYAGYYLSKNIKASYYYPKIITVKYYEQNIFHKYLLIIRRYLINVRKGYEKIISRTMPEPEAGLLSGILLGSRANLSDDFTELLAKTGIIHIVALSGYNITIVASFFAIVGKPLVKKFTFWLSIIGIWVFVFATGLSASVVRAAIMGSLLIIASMFGRRSSAFISVIFASSLMIFFNPYVLLYDIGFQLSFSAVCGILFLAPRLEKSLNIENSFFGKLLVATFSAQIFTIPIISLYFGRISIVSLLTNLLVLPFIPFVMLFGFISLSVGYISLWLSEKLLIITWVILSYFKQIVRLLGNLELAEIEYQMNIVTLVGIYIILFELIIIFKKRSRYEQK